LHIVINLYLHQLILHLVLHKTLVAWRLCPLRMI